MSKCTIGSKLHDLDYDTLAHSRMTRFHTICDLSAECKGFTHIWDKQQVWSNATDFDAILGDLPRLQNMHMQGTRVE